MTENAQCNYEGIIVSGTGNMSRRMSAASIALKVYEEATGCKLVPGSLNVELAEEVDMPIYAKQLIREDHEGTAILFITPAHVNHIPGFVVRNKRAEDGQGRHSKRVVEVISSYRLRAELGLTDGDKVMLTF